MKATVYTKENNRLAVNTIEAENEEDICLQVFENECAEMYSVPVIGIRFGNEKIMPWNGTAAHYCFGKGRTSFDEFISDSKDYYRKYKN